MLTPADMPPYNPARNARVEPLVADDLPIVWWIKLAANIAAGLAIVALPFAWMLWKGLI